MRIGGPSIARSYQLTNGTEIHQIGKVNKEHNLGSNDLKFDKHANLVIKKANSILVMVKCKICLWDFQMFCIMYTTLVRSYLGFG